MSADKRFHRRLAWTFNTGLAVLLPSAAIATAQSGTALRQPDVSYVVTTKGAVQMMLKLADVKKSDIVYDLGCGDGRIVIAAAEIYGARGVGIDIDPRRIRRLTHPRFCSEQHEQMYLVESQKLAVARLRSARLAMVPPQTAVELPLTDATNADGAALIRLPAHVSA